MSTLIPNVLGCASSTLTTLATPPERGSIILEIGDMRREGPPNPHFIISLSEHVSIRSFSIANWS